MWTYWEKFYSNCASANATTDRFAPSCSYRQMQTLTATTLYGIISKTVDTNAIAACVSNALLPEPNNKIPVFQQYIWDWQLYNPPIKAVRAWVNNESYPADVQCRLPITEATCGPLSGICHGYADNEQNQPMPYPLPCSWDNQCTFGVMNCIGINTVTGNTGGSGVSAGAGVGIIIAFLVILIAGLYYWYRRQQLRMKGEMDALLRQYLPMDPGTTRDGARGREDPRAARETTHRGHGPRGPGNGDEGRQLTLPHTAGHAEGMRKKGRRWMYLGIREMRERGAGSELMSAFIERSSGASGGAEANQRKNNSRCGITFLCGSTHAVRGSRGRPPISRVHLSLPVSHRHCVAHSSSDPALLVASLPLAPAAADSTQHRYRSCRLILSSVA